MTARNLCPLEARCPECEAWRARAGEPDTDDSFPLAFVVCWFGVIVWWFR